MLIIMFKKLIHICLIITSLLIIAQPICIFAHSKKNERKVNNSLTQQQIAKKLNWVSLPNGKCDHCAGYYKEPKVVSKYPQPLYIRQETTHIRAAGPTLFSKYGWG